MLSQKQIYQYAIKGIAAEIEQLEKSIRRGYQYIEQIDRGEKPKTSKTKSEIISIISNKKAEIERLDKEKFDISWKVDVDMQ